MIRVLTGNTFDIFMFWFFWGFFGAKVEEENLFGETSRWDVLIVQSLQSKTNDVHHNTW